MAPRIVIVGGVAAGMSAATRARRLNERSPITVLERGGYISFANCGLPYYLSGRISGAGNLLLATPEGVRSRYRIDARVRHEVTAIDRAAKRVEGFDHVGDRRFSAPYDKLILATGATPVVPPLPNADAPNVFSLRSMEDMQAIRRWLETDRPRHAVIVGAGFVGLEMAEALVDCGLEVTIVERAAAPLPALDPEMAGYVRDVLDEHDVRLLTGAGLVALHTEQGVVTEVEVDGGERVPADMVILSMGVRPNVALGEAAGLKVGDSGALAVDEYLRTSDPDIYAAGDAAEVVHRVTGQTMHIPLAGPANRLGRLAGEHAATGASARADRVLGTAILRIFDLAMGVTGLTAAAAAKAGIVADVAYVHPNHRAGYYPDTKQIHLKLVYEEATGRLLGAQAVGRAGVDKRLDVIATAIHFGGTVNDLASLDLAYAPQFSSAKDPVHEAGFVAQNQRSGLMPAIHPTNLNGQQLVDVRAPAEFAQGTLEGAVNIPLDELRDRLTELDPARPTVVFCQQGRRGYVAQRVLLQHGFGTVRNLKGGYTLAKRVRRPQC